jgi:hypothetical protein
VDVQIGQIGLLLHLRPEAADFPDRLADGFAGEQPWVALRDDQLALAHDGHDLLRDRDTVDLALLRGRGGFRPDNIVEVELFEPRRPHLAHRDPGAGRGSCRRVRWQAERRLMPWNTCVTNTENHSASSDSRVQHHAKPQATQKPDARTLPAPVA